MKKIGILIVSYNAVTTISSVLRRIPENVWQEIDEVAIFDDASKDDTHILAHGYADLHNLNKVTIIKNQENLGYGGNQKAGYKYFMDKNFDVVVLLHGDGQYAPEILSEMYTPILEGKADAVFGSRMLDSNGGALKGGMPFYKYIGNKILTFIENSYLKMHLSEFHSGYRAYALSALKEINLTTLTNDFYFDTQIIIKLHHQHKIIHEIPIPTYYGSEICYVNGMMYAKNIIKTLKEYHYTINGIDEYAPYAEYFPSYLAHIDIENSSHALLAKLAGKNTAILDLGCSDTSLGAYLEKNGNTVYGIDAEPILPPKTSRIHGFRQHNLEKGIMVDDTWPKTYTTIIMGDIIEHLANPAPLLDSCHNFLTPHGQCIVSIPNVANIVSRVRLFFGIFSYSSRGIFDKSHLRFYTYASAKALFKQHNFSVTQMCPTSLPIEIVFGKNCVSRAAAKFLRVVTRLLPRLFAYQFVFVLKNKQ